MTFYDFEHVFCRMLIQFIVSGDPNTWKGLLIASLMLLSTFFYSIFINNFTYYGMVAGMRARTQMNAAVYRKVSDYYQSELR